MTALPDVAVERTRVQHVLLVLNDAALDALPVSAFVDEIRFDAEHFASEAQNRGGAGARHLAQRGAAGENRR